MRFHLLMLIIVVIVSLGMHGMASAAPRSSAGLPMAQPVPPAGG